MKAYIIFAACLILCSCHANFESARVEYYSPSDRLDDNLKGNVYKVEQTYYQNLHARDKQINNEGKILKLDNSTSKTTTIYSEKGIRLSYLYNFLGELSSKIEYDNQGRKIYSKHRYGDIESKTYKMLSTNVELVEILRLSVDSNDNEIKESDSYTIEYDDAGLPLVIRDKNGKITEEWTIGKGKDNSEKHTYYDEYPNKSYIDIYDKGELIEEHYVKENKLYTYTTEYVGEIKRITKTLKSDTNTIALIEDYKDDRLIKQISDSKHTTYYNDNGDKFRVVNSGIHPYSFHYEYEYDSHGNWVVSRKFDSDGICSNVSIRKISYYDDPTASDFLNQVLEKYIEKKYVKRDSHHGHEHVVKVPVQRFKQCPGCLGGGLCSYCNGSGIYYHPGGQTYCAACGGRGRCSLCAGRGGEYVTEY